MTGRAIWSVINAASERHSIECNKYPYPTESNHISHLLQNRQLPLIFLPKPPSNLRMLSSSAWASHLKIEDTSGKPLVVHHPVGLLQPTMLIWLKCMVHLGAMPTGSCCFGQGTRLWACASSSCAWTEGWNLHVFSIWQSGYQISPNDQNILHEILHDLSVECGMYIWIIWIRWLTCWAGLHRIVCVFSQDCAGLCKHACFGLFRWRISAETTSPTHLPLDIWGPPSHTA